MSYPTFESDFGEGETTSTTGHVAAMGCMRLHAVDSFTGFWKPRKRQGMLGDRVAACCDVFRVVYGGFVCAAEPRKRQGASCLPVPVVELRQAPQARVGSAHAPLQLNAT